MNAFEEKQRTLLNSIFKNVCSQGSYFFMLRDEFFVNTLEKDLYTS